MKGAYFKKFIKTFSIKSKDLLGIKSTTEDTNKVVNKSETSSSDCSLPPMCIWIEPLWDPFFR
jgi:hypothetical protein